MSVLWQVRIKRSAAKLYDKLPDDIKSAADVLAMEMKFGGPVRGNWKNYSKLGPDKHHCHLRGGKPTYVACWDVNKKERIIEVYYVGTHEKAPY